MLYEFKSKATGTVVMIGSVAEQVLAVVGKAPGPNGIFTVEQMGPAIAALQAAVDRERSERNAASSQAASGKTTHATDEHENHALETVSLAQRAWPLIDMLRAAQAAGKVVTWGV